MLLQEQLRVCRQFVSDHESYDRVYDQCRSWCEDVAERLELCLKMDYSRASIESKLSQLNELSSRCNDEGVGLIQGVRVAAAVILHSTSVDGGNAVNKSVSELVTYWGALVEKICSARDKLEVALMSYNEFEASVTKLLQQLRDMEDEYNRLSVLQSTLSEKMSLAVHSKVYFTSCVHFLFLCFIL